MLPEFEKSISALYTPVRYYLCKLLKTADKFLQNKKKRGNRHELEEDINYRDIRK